LSAPDTVSPHSCHILVVDNYDSFVFTIVGYLQQLGAHCEVLRNDAVTPADGADFDGVLVSPGPGTPQEAGVSMAMISACAERTQPLNALARAVAWTAALEA